MKIGITGANGFIGWHLRCYLKSRDDIEEVRTADKATFADENLLRGFVEDLDTIVHLAGVNRADEMELIEGNKRPVKQLVKTLQKTSNTPCIIFSSSTHTESPSTPYGKGKAAARQIFDHWSTLTGARFLNMVIPHVFGEYGLPHYNSAVSTFCHQITRGETPSVNPVGQLELVHVQDLAEQIMELAENGATGDARIEGLPIGVLDVAEKLQEMYRVYVEEGQFPNLNDRFDRSLFNSLRGAIPNDERLRESVKHTDKRGWLVETVKALSGGQCFISTTKPSITRGNHFHRRKVERFFVLQGKAQIRLRRLFSNEILSYELDGCRPSYVDIPTLHTHNITNIGDTDLITLFWADEFFDQKRPDTFSEEV